MYKWKAILAFLYFFGGSSAWAETIFIHRQSESKIKLSAQLSYWKDDTNLLTLDAIREKFALQQRKRPESESLNLGFTQASYWFAFKVKFAENPQMPWYIALEWPNMDYIDVFIFQGNQRVRSYESGDLRLFEQRSLDERNFYFEVPTDTQEELTVFVRTKTDGSMNVALYLQSLKSVSAGNHNLQLFLGLFCGSVLIMAIYFLLIGIFSRNLENFYLGLFFLAGAAFRLTYHGLTYQYLLPHSPKIVNILIPVSLTLLFLFLSMFSRKFLELKDYRRLSVLSDSLVFAWALMPLAASFWGNNKILKIMIFGMGIWSCLYWIALALYRWRQGLRSALALALALSYPAWGAVAVGFIFIGIFPGTQFVVYAIETSIVLFTLLLALSASRKINEYNNKVKTAQEEVIKAQVHSRDAIEKLNFGLEKLVEEKTRHIRSILNSIELGIFTINKETYAIDPEYSPFMATLFGDEPMSRLSPLDLLFPAQSSLDLRDRTANSIRLILGEDVLNFQINHANLIDEVTLVTGHNEERILRIDWNPIIADNVVDKLLVTIKDVTAIRNLHTKMYEHQKELAIVGEIIALDEKDFSMFLSSAFKLLNKAALQVGKLETFDPHALNDILISLHTVKGEARTLDLSALTNMIHDVESTFKTFLEAGGRDWDQRKAQDRIQEILSLRNIYFQVARNLLRRPNTPEPEDVVIETGPANLVDLSDELRHIHRLMKPTAEALGKDFPRFEIESAPCPSLSTHGQSIVRSIFVHMFRNSIDHGIETPKDRASSDKPRQGTIFCTIREHDADLELIWSDDGRGLDMDKLRGLGQSMKPIQSDEDLAALIFEPGVSTKENVSDVSGRGLGMHAVLTSIESHGGTIRVDFTSGPNPLGFRSFAFRITLPRDSSLFVDDARRAWKISG